jgi:hypothetical protein
MATYRVDDGQYSRTTSLVIAATGSGAERRWTPPPSSHHGSAGALYWLADNRTLALSWWPTGDLPTAQASERFLDTSAPGGSLPGGRAVLPLIVPAGEFPAFVPSGNGRVLVGSTLYYQVGTVHGRRAVGGSLIRFAQPGGQASFLYRPSDQGDAAPGLCQQPRWVSPSGQTVLAGCFRNRQAVQLVLLSKGHATVLPRLSRLVRQSDMLAIGA